MKLSDIRFDKDNPNRFFSMERGADSMECRCGGYAERVKCTPAEIKDYDWCGWGDIRGGECCARAFVCKVCKTRYVGGAQAPGMD